MSMRLLLTRREIHVLNGTVTINEPPCPGRYSVQQYTTTIRKAKCETDIDPKPSIPNNPFHWHIATRPRRHYT
ncbi:hypothetical protein M408DRAFT_334122 [Serendipita vermifera MAFF 305830]|uniref:Uncharacterized protein n=1 Tax=Serendipita vermifera MAFF 305830 TaxID=933852 RepID=A0A0C2W0W8_SERVB|nr:hypothetical protein M408DRAFT_334122 [Serendipita vermifera MAFF 305830]